MSRRCLGDVASHSIEVDQFSNAWILTQQIEEHSEKTPEKHQTWTKGERFLLLLLS